MLFPAGAGKPPPLNLTHQVPPWWEEVSSNRLAMGFGECWRWGFAEGKAPLPPPSTRGR